MIGRDDSLQTLGIIPCAISWLFKLINERKEKTGARFSVRVSAVEVSDKPIVTLLAAFRIRTGDDYLFSLQLLTPHMGDSS